MLWFTQCNMTLTWTRVAEAEDRAGRAPAAGRIPMLTSWVKFSVACLVGVVVMVAAVAVAEVELATAGANTISRIVICTNCLNELVREIIRVTPRKTSRLPSRKSPRSCDGSTHLATTRSHRPKPESVDRL